MLPPTRAVTGPFVAAIILAACGGGNLASRLANAPEYAPKGQTKCGVAKSQAKPLIVEWPSAERMELESKIRQGIVAVKYIGCEMTVLDRCSVPAKYTYQGATRNQDKVEMKDEDDLYANLPVGAARLEGWLQHSGRLTVDMNLVGRFEADKKTVRADELQGDCAGATHFVYGVTVGAFDFYAGGQASVGADAGVGGFGGGGHSQAERETLTKAGDQAACEKATTGDTAPPEGCGALIRIEVVPLGEAIAGVAPVPSPPSSGSCPAGMASLPGGTFTMGGHKVAPFCLDVTEVTVDAYTQCVHSRLCGADGLNPFPQCNYGVSGKGNHPINCLNWRQADAYCFAQGKRLPTAQEWELAARGENRGRAYPWGNTPPASQLCWSGMQGRDGTCAVGSFRGGDAPGGIQDLGGNVSEWTESLDDGDRTARVVCGNSWRDNYEAQVACRQSENSNRLGTDLGFRCAR
jgi:formylglycine-generating enzyme required for sulfatase activity